MSKTINAGRVTFVPKDNFSNNISYKKFDIVTYNGSSYFAKKDTIGHTPTEEEFWQLVAEKGQNGEPGAVKMQVVDTLPETGRTDTIYLVKKDNPGEQNLYDEYVYTDTGWEHIGDTSVDLSNYQEKLTPGDNINIDNNVISATFQKEVIELTDEVIILSQLNPGVYILKPTVKKIKYSSYDADTYLTDGKTHIMLVGTAGTTYNTAYIFSDNGILRLNCYDNGNQKIECSIRDMANILSKKNTSTYIPTGNYHPATKKYVDDSPTTYTGYDATKTQVLKNINGTLTWVNE